MAESWGTTALREPSSQVIDIPVDTVETTEEATPQPIQEKKINKKKLLELQPNGKELSIYVRDAKHGALLPIDSIKNVPRDAAAICSDLLYDKLQNPKYYHIIRSKEDVFGQKYVFDWIKKCGAEQAVVNIEDVHDIINETDGYTPLVSVMKAAHYLKVPEASFGKFILIKARNVAKDILVPLSLISQAYDSGHEDYLGDVGLRELFVESIFEHWYNYKLEDKAHDDYMEQLTIMRNNIRELDEDLKAAVVAKDERIKASRERKKAKEAENAAVEDSGAASFDGGVQTGGGFGSGWENTDTSAGEVKGNWDTETGGDLGAGNNQWAGDAGATDDFGASANNWADEVNESSVSAVVAQTPAVTANW